MLQYVPEEQQGFVLPTMLVEQNIEYLIDQQWDRMAAANDSGQTASWPFAAELERERWHRADRCGVVSLDDLDHIQEVAPEVRPVYVPHGSDHLELLAPDAPRATDDLSGGSATVVFVGDYTYPPTHEAAVHLLTDIWPLVLRRHPAARLALVLSFAGGETSVQPAWSGWIDVEQFQELGLDACADHDDGWAGDGAGSDP
jgi:hypothetical protein